MPACTGCNSRRAKAIRIETERLILDLHRLDQFEHLAQMWADEAVIGYIGAPSTLQESWARLLRYRGLWPLLGYGYWALTEKRSGRFVGDLGFADFTAWSRRRSAACRKPAGFSPDGPMDKALPAKP